MTAGFLVRVPLSFLSPPAILSPRVAWRFWWWTFFLPKNPWRVVVVRDPYLRAILFSLMSVFLVVVKDLKD